jgi:hypothetical protein
MPIKPSAEDIRRCGDEIKQLRNQQFILSTTAFGLLGAYGTLLPDFGQSPEGVENADPITVIWSAIVLILIFGFLFYWARQLRLLIGVISVWLDCVAESVWERDYRAYHQRFRPLSQTSLVSFAFCALGVAYLTTFGVQSHGLILLPCTQLSSCMCLRSIFSASYD